MTTDDGVRVTRLEHDLDQANQRIRELEQRITALEGGAQ